MQRAITVTAGVEILGKEELLLLRLPDGSPGALRRGQVFRLGPEDTIDVDGEFDIPGACHPFIDVRSSMPPADWVLTQDDPPILLIRGDEAARDRILCNIESAGGRIYAVGPYLASSEDQTPLAEWFAIPAGISRTQVEKSLEKEFASRLPIQKTAEELLATALERAFLLREALEHLRGEVATAAVTISNMANRLQTAESAWMEEAAAREAAENLARAANQAAPPPPMDDVSLPRSTRRAITDLSSDFQFLLPKLCFMRGSAEFLILSIQNREPILRILRSLQDSPDDLRHWKTIRGVSGWQERHFSNGQDNTGRIYARLRPDGVIDILLSMKGTQDRDITWLQDRS
jgi:hypothetical protein